MSDDRYTSVVYVHGMGTQRRLEEVSRLVDGLDRFAHYRVHEFGPLGRIHLHVEPSRIEGQPEVSYVQVTRTTPNEKTRRDVRFYEAYWANITAEGVPPREVAQWLFTQVLVPIRALYTRWRLRARLRRAALVRLWPEITRGVDGLHADDLETMLALYDWFESAAARRNYPEGSSGEFLDFIPLNVDHSRGRPGWLRLRAHPSRNAAVEPSEPSASSNHASDPGRAARLVTLAQRWHSGYVRTEWRNLFVIGTIALAMLVGAGSAALLVLTLLRLASDTFAHTRFAALLPDANWKNAAFGAATLLLAAGGRKFLSEYLGDVQFWTTYEETASKNEKRRKILTACSDTLRHVLADPKCERVVIVSHSLGTTIALDSILALARENRAQCPDDESNGEMKLEKISHFVTMGSPIDKVHYFFESYASRYHRYNRVVEELRGDIGTWPFAWDAKARVHWINFWDRADIISGALYTPTNRAYATIRVDNVHTNNLGWPNPAGAHLGYFENAQVIEAIFRATFDDAFELEARTGVAEPKDAERDAVLASQTAFSSTGILHGILLAVPWLVVAGAVAVKLGASSWIAVSALVPLAIVAFVMLAARPVRPIDLKLAARRQEKKESPAVDAIAPQAEAKGDDDEEAA